MTTPEVRTERLLLRGWQPSDKGPFATMNADPQVMRWLLGPITAQQSDASVDRQVDGWAERGWGLFALELLTTGEFLGYTGLAPSNFDAHFTPAVEIGWRLARRAWGNGYATEAALAALRFGVVDCGLQEIVSWTAATNRRSRAVMERIGLVRDPADDFGHPRVPEQDALHPHVLYRMAAETRVNLLATAER